MLPKSTENGNESVMKKKMAYPKKRLNVFCRTKINSRSKHIKRNTLFEEGTLFQLTCF